jgi:hypothetical protein
MFNLQKLLLSSTNTGTNIFVSLNREVDQSSQHHLHRGNMGKADIGIKALSHAAHKKKSVTKLSAASLISRSRDPSATDVRLYVSNPIHSLCLRRAQERCDERQPEKRRGDAPPTLPRRVMSISDSPPSLPRRVLSVSDSVGDFATCAMRQRLSVSVESQGSHDGSLRMHNAVFPTHAIRYESEPTAPPPRKKLNPFLDLSRGSDQPPRRALPGYLKVDRPPTLPRVRRARYHSNNVSVSGLSALTASIRIQSSENVASAMSANPTGSVRSS